MAAALRELKDHAPALSLSEVSRISEIEVILRCYPNAFLPVNLATVPADQGLRSEHAFSLRYNSERI
jgi:hypothetical protein